MRICLKCRQEKALTEFNKHKYCKDCSRAYGRLCTRRYRTQALEILGNQCACCGETTFEFLQIDHINNDGKQHRAEKALRSTFSLYKAIKEEPTRFQILCGNCHTAKSYYGGCIDRHQHTKRVS